ncbi:hypothetical protein [Ekhidna sp.]|uniref:hypothetical protein n=1 Tax=Ekhidna sp. TaxID=2608089 RepID=UPI003CCB8930
MKSTFIYFIVFLSITTISFAQQNQNSGISSPGEKVEASTNTGSGQVQEYDTEILEKRIERRKKSIKSLYIIEEEIAKAYGTGTQTVTKKLKKHIYRAGQKLIDSYEGQLSEANSEEDKVEILNEITKVQDQLIYFSKQEKTRPVEKKLKKLKTPQEISEVFFSVTE